MDRYLNKTENEIDLIDFEFEITFKDFIDLIKDGWNELLQRIGI